MTRPFPFESPVDPLALIDRHDELRSLHLAAVDGAHVRLAAPRRYGKTSVVLAHAARLRETGWRTIHVDLYGVTSLAEVCSRIATGYARSKESQVMARLASLGSRLGVALTVAGIGVSVQPAQQRIPAQDAWLTATAELLDLPLRLYERDRRKTLVVFDEFQDLLAAGSTLDGLLRSHLQYHGDAATYIYAGSQPSLMRRLFTDRERPLYGQAEPLELSPLPFDDVLDELSQRFADLGEDPGDALAPLVLAGAGHPQRTMLLAHLLHRELTTRGDAESISDPDGTQDMDREAPQLDGIALADLIIGRAVAQTSEAHHAVWDSLSAGKKAILAALADGVRPTGSRATERSGLSRAALQSALRELAREGQHVTRITVGPPTSGDWRFVDPLFARWVSQRGSTSVVG